MTVQTMPWSIQGGTHPAEVQRNAQAAMFGVPVAAHTAGVSVVTAGGGHGVVDSGDLAVTQNGTPNMSVNVAAGRAIIRSGGSSSLLAGSYAFLNDATLNVAISASDPTNPRIDLVVAQVRDTNYGEAASDARLTVVAGTPAASPAVPSLTSYPNCLVLAQVAVAAAVTTIVTANITDKRTRAYALGGVAKGPTALIPTGASLHKGLRWFDETTLTEKMYDGTGWIVMAEPRQTYTPALSGITIGNGSVTGTSHRSDGYCDFSAKVTWGSTSSFTSSFPTIGLPYACGVALTNAFNFVTEDVSNLPFTGFTGVYAGSADVRLYLLNVAGTYPILSTAISATVPFTWASGDTLDISGRFPLNTRYL